MGKESSSSSSSSGEEDGDAEWRASINSVAAATSFASYHNGSCKDHNRAPSPEIHDESHKPKTLKLYQIKAQKILDDLIEKSIEIVQQPIHATANHSSTDEGGVRLFRDAPCGIIFDRVDELQRPRKRPRILPANDIDEKSRKFRRHLRSVAVDGTDIIASAQEALQKSLARLEARDTAAKAAAKREEERVAELKRIRGERWLPSIAREMRLK